jgi:hypothetical protein
MVTDLKLRERSVECGVEEWKWKWKWKIPVWCVVSRTAPRAPAFAPTR